METNPQTLKEIIDIMNSTDWWMFGITAVSVVISGILNIINTLNRRLTTEQIPDEERLTVSEEEHQQPLTPKEQKVALKKQLEDGLITNEQYYNKVKELKIK